MDPGAFICSESDFAGQNRDGKRREIDCKFVTDSVDYSSRILADAMSSEGAEVCDFMRARASNRLNGFLYNQRVRVR
jgi:hypothetical protein